MLYGSEGSALDFKRDQYKFNKATNEEKSELLKDILAMANAWESGERYIILGIVDKPDKPNEMYGITENIDDAQLQQFINSKTNRLCEFSYNTASHDGKTFGIIIIPKQQRPIYLKNDFWKLKKDSVYVKRGSATEIAKPDEIAAMGSDGTNKIAELEINFYDDRKGDILPKKLDIETTRFELSTQLPDYKERDYLVVGENKDYYRDVFKYMNFHSSYTPICLCISNNGNIEAKNIRVEIIINNSNIDIKKESQATKKPDKSMFGNIQRNLFKELKIEEFEIDVKNNEIRLYKSISTVHAKRNFEIERIIFINPKETKLIPLEVNIYCDGIEKPFKETLEINCSHETKKINLEEFFALLNEINTNLLDNST